MTCPLNLPQKEPEYMKMKKKLYKKFFQDLLTLFSIMPAVELTRALVLADSALFYSTLATLIVEVTLGLIVLKMNKHQEVAITIFIVLFITASLVTNYYGETQFFKSIHGTFHYSSATTAFMYAIGNRIPKFSHRAAYNTSLLIIKLIVVSVDDLSTLPGHAIILSFCIYLDYDREKHDQKLFDSNFYSKEQLTKFKDLVVDDIPDSLVIVTQDLHRCLFTNTAWNALFEGERNSSIIDCMQKFSIQENLNGESSDDHLETVYFGAKQTLLEFIQDHVQLETDKNKQISKTSCNVLYYKETMQEKSDSFDGLTNTSQSSFEAKILPLIWDEQPALGIILHDTTQQDMLLRLKTAANVQKDKILATVSHELRTPLNGMLGMIQFLQQEIKDSNILHYLKLCSNSGNLLLGIVNSILDLNMIKANKLKLSVECLEIESFLEDFLKLFEFQCQQKGLFLKLDISPLVPKYIKTDKNRLSQIFLNLIGNAFKFTETGGITVSVEPSHQGKGFLNCSVEDTGLGIKKEDQPKLFKMFGKLEEKKRKGTIVNSQGVGLGLTISDNLARLLCTSKDIGGIKVKSEYNKGSKFSFIINGNLTLSSEKEESSENQRNSSESFDEGDTGINETIGYQYRKLAGKKSLDCSSNSTQFLSFEQSRVLENECINPLQKYKSISNIGWPVSSPSSANKRKQTSVLIVDDNPLNITVVELLLRRHKFNVKSALSGQEAIKMLQKNDYNQEPIGVILMDLQMPVMDGYQTSKKIKDLMREKKIPEIPIIALTANDSENDKRSCLKAGMIGHLSKPLKEEDLAKILKRYE